MDRNWPVGVIIEHMTPQEAKAKTYPDTRAETAPIAWIAYDPPQNPEWLWCNGDQIRDPESMLCGAYTPNLTSAGNFYMKVR